MPAAPGSAGAAGRWASAENSAPAGAGFDKEAAQPPRRPRPHDRQIGNVAIGDPHFRAIEYPAVAVAARRGTHGGGVGTALGLGQAEAADDFAARHARQPL